MREAENNPNVHSYSSSSVMHYSSNGGDGGQPKMYHATTSTRKAPGGVSDLSLLVFCSACFLVVNELVIISR